MALAHSIWTLLLVLTFVGIVVWAWSSGRRRRFAEAAQLPLQPDAPSPQPAARDGKGDCDMTERRNDG